MKSDFDEGFLSESRDPLDAPHQNFDWELLYERLDEGKVEGPARDQLIARLVQLVISNDSERLIPKKIGLRIIALAWVLNPAYFPGSPSLRQLAKRCGVTAPTLARLTGEFSRMTGLRNRAQRHAWNWKKE
jgi:hypothetical protein